MFTCTLLLTLCPAIPQTDDGSSPETRAPLWDSLKFDFTTLENGDGESTIGLRYELDAPLIESDTDGYWLADLDLHFRGTVAANSDVNPENLLVNELDFTFGTGESSVDALSNWGFDFRLSAALDADQTFSARQYRYGLDLQVTSQMSGVRALDEHVSSAWADWLWIADYPAAALRYISGAQRDFWPGYFPNIGFGIDQVSPEGDDPRAAVGDDSDFARLRGDIEYRPLVFGQNDESWTLGVTYEWYYELDPSTAVKDAGLDSFEFFRIDLIRASEQGFFARYVNGQLPFDVNSGEAYQIGWAFNI